MGAVVAGTVITAAALFLRFRRSRQRALGRVPLALNRVHPPSAAKSVGFPDGDAAIGQSAQAQEPLPIVTTPIAPITANQAAPAAPLTSSSPDLGSRLLGPAAVSREGELSRLSRPVTKPLPDGPASVLPASITTLPEEISSAPGSPALRLNSPEEPCKLKTTVAPVQPQAICTTGLHTPDLLTPAAAPAEPRALPEIIRGSPAAAGEAKTETSTPEPDEPEAVLEIAQERPAAAGEAETESPTAELGEPEAVRDVSDSTPAAIGDTKAVTAPAAAPIPARPHRAVHRDRRGARRSAPGQADAPSTPTLHEFRQAEAKIRLALDPIRRSARLSLVLSRPAGFPDTVCVDLGGPQVIGAYDETRYDDLDLDWTAELLADELRFSDPGHRVQWIRSARAIHLFGQSELDFISVPAARASVQHAVVCRDTDAASVTAAAARAGSPLLTSVAGWSGIPPGWTVFPGYSPSRQISPIDDPRLRSLDIGSAVEIHLRGGLRIRAEHFAEGKPPSIFVEPLPSDCQVTIDGQPAFQAEDSAWAAPNSEHPGRHLVDVIGGPSLTYTVEPDPGATREWTIPGEALRPFGAPPPVPVALIGAHANPLSRSAVVATEPSGSVVAIGSRAGVYPLGSRPDVPAAVAAVPFEAAFAIVSWGPRRHQGRILYLGSPGPGRMGRRPDMNWVSAVVSAAARRLDVIPADDAAKRAWRSAVIAARRARRLRI